MTSKGDFSRQQFLGEDSEHILANARATIVGLGGGGSHIAQQLAHVGVGNIRLIDPQEMEDSNLNRLVGGAAKDVKARTPKVDIAERLIHGVRPWVKVEKSQTEWQQKDEFIKDSHVVFGCVDGYRQRSNLESIARRFCVPYIDIGMDVTRISKDHFAVAGQIILSLPGGPCMRCIGFLTQARLNKEEDNYGDAGINPQVVWTNGTLASLAVGTFVRLLSPWAPFTEHYQWLELDGNSQTVTPSRQPMYMPKGPCIHFRPEDVGDPFFDLKSL